MAAALPPLAELEKLTFDAILEGYKGTIVQTAKALGIDLTDAERRSRGSSSGSSA